MTEPMHAEIVELDPGAELVPYEPAGAVTLYGTSDPRIALERMSELAQALMDVVREQKLAVQIRGNEHLTIDAWVTLGALVGVHAAITWTRPTETGDGILARAEARTLDGRLVGAAEAECSRAEQRWKQADGYAVRSMASTRAMSRALQAPLRHIAVLAGYESTTSEEMPVNEPPEPKLEPKIPPEAQPTEEQVAALRALVGRLAEQQPDVDWWVRCRELAGVPGDKLTRGGADGLIRRLGELDRESGEAPFE